MPSDFEAVAKRLENLERDLASFSQNRERSWQEIWTALRSAQQEIAVANSERRHSDDRAQRIENRINSLEDLINKRFQELNLVMVSKERYQNVERIVYGLVAIILSGVVMAVGTALLK